jgi:hypothetical protein
MGLGLESTYGRNLKLMEENNVVGNYKKMMNWFDTAD